MKTKIDFLKNKLLERESVIRTKRLKIKTSSGKIKVFGIEKLNIRKKLRIKHSSSKTRIKEGKNVTRKKLKRSMQMRDSEGTEELICLDQYLFVDAAKENCLNIKLSKWT